MLRLDLMELADLVQPKQFVDEILKQNPELPLPTPVVELARLAGISKIEAFSSQGFEGTLIANAEKTDGAIFYNGTVPRTRQRFTIGHELGHFLLPWHHQSTFECTAEDISNRTRKDWEAQANQFSAELLMPKALVNGRLQAYGAPEIAHIQEISNQFEVSFEAASRRLIELSEYPCAVVFSKDNVVRYWVKNDYFAGQIVVQKGDKLPHKSYSNQAKSDPEEWHELIASSWVKESQGDNLTESIYEQTLCQESGYKVTLLSLG